MSKYQQFLPCYGVSRYEKKLDEYVEDQDGQ